MRNTAIENEHWICNKWFLYEMLQKSDWEWTWGLSPQIYIRNFPEIVLGTNIGFVTNALHSKYTRHRIGNERRVCNHWFTYEYSRSRIGNEHMVCNHGFSWEIVEQYDYHRFISKHSRHRIGNEHRVCNHRFIHEILQKSHWEWTYGV